MKSKMIIFLLITISFITLIILTNNVYAASIKIGQPYSRYCGSETASGHRVIILQKGIYGDANADGKVTATDARLILRWSAGLEKMPNYYLCSMNCTNNYDIVPYGVVINPRLSADVDGDNKITAADARLVLRYSAKLK